MYNVGNAGSRRVVAAKSRQRKEMKFLDGITIGVDNEDHLDFAIDDAGNPLHVTRLVQMIQDENLDPSMFSFKHGDKVVSFDDLNSSIKIIADCNKKLRALGIK